MKNERPDNSILSFIEYWAEQQPTWFGIVIAGIVFGVTYSIMDSLVNILL